MRKKINIWEIVGFFVVVALGCILHFVYEWSGYAMVVAPFSAINESTWEHMKILFVPFFGCALLERVFLGRVRGFWRAKLAGALVGISLIPVLFYTYNGVVGKSPEWLNVGIFVIAAACAFLIGRSSMRERREGGGIDISLGAMCVLAALFFVFSFVQPPLAIFASPPLVG